MKNRKDLVIIIILNTFWNLSMKDLTKDSKKGTHRSISILDITIIIIIRRIITIYKGINENIGNIND
jgi:hypothetical protein